MSDSLRDIIIAVLEPRLLSLMRYPDESIASQNAATMAGALIKELMLETSYADAVKRLDQALARGVQLEVDAKNWRIKSGQWRIKYEQADQENTDLKAQMQLVMDASTELMKLVDSLRNERDTWRAKASQ